MDMKIVKSEKRLCPCCMEEHEVKTVLVEETATLKKVRLITKHPICFARMQRNCIWKNHRCRKMIFG